MVPGLDSSIKNTIKEQYAPLTFKQRDKVTFEDNHVVIADWLTRILYTRGPNKNGLLTGLEYYRMAMQPVHDSFKSGCSVYVAIIDDVTNIPPEKGDTQRRRKVAKAKQLHMKAKKAGLKPIIPYRDNVIINDDGIYDPDTETTDKIDMDRLSISSSIKTALWKYIAKLMHEEPLSDGKLLIFEYSKSGPEFIPSVHNWPTSTTPLPKTFLHNHGEGDPSCLFWASIFRRHPTVSMVSTDSDLIALYAACMALRPDLLPKRLYWQHAYGSIVDMPAMLARTCSVLDLKYDEFALFCIFCGTDFVLNESYAFGFGVMPMLYACRRAQSRLRKMCDSRTGIKLDDVMYVLRCLYQHGRKKGLVTEMEHLADKQSLIQSLNNGKKKRKLSHNDDDDSYDNADDDNDVIITNKKHKKPKKGKEEEEDDDKDKDIEVVQDEEEETDESSTSSSSTNADYITKIIDDIAAEICKGVDSNKPPTRVVKRMSRDPPEWEKLEPEYVGCKKYQFPDFDAIQYAHHCIEFNLNYWRKPILHSIAAY